MDDKEKALAFLRKERLSYADMTDVIEKGAAVFLYVGEDGVLLYERSSGIYMLSASGFAAAKKILSDMDVKAFCARRGTMVAHGEEVRRAFLDKFPSATDNTCCVQVVYDKLAPVQTEQNLDISLATREEIEKVKTLYNREPPERLERLFKEKKIYCAHKKSDGSFVGFIGRHPEGSMGLLFILPDERRKGFAEELEGFLVNVILSEGRIPYAHILSENDKSLHLQEKLGFSRAPKLVFWHDFTEKV